MKRTESKLDQAMTAIDQATADLEAALAAIPREREKVADAIEAALRAGGRPSDIARRAKVTGETVRRIARKRGVPRRREPTVVSIKSIQDATNS